MKKLIYLLLVIFILTSCGGQKDVHLSFKSHEDFLEFIEEYNSKRDDFTYTFVSFDFPDSLNIEVYEYDVWTTQKYIRYPFTNKIVTEELTDKTGSHFLYNMIFYASDVSEGGDIIEHAYQINCEYNTKNYNFYQADEMRIENVSGYISGVSLIDLSSWDKSTHSYTRNYNYAYSYQLYVNDVEEVKITICTQKEASQEKLSEICQMLIDNIIIVN